MIIGICIITLSFIFCWLAFRFYSKGNTRVALVFILLMGLILRLYVASDKYLHTWDERYHALVAKNMIKHPLKPTLYDNPLLHYDPGNWVANHVWLEKGPVPLWAVAFSLKVLGFSEYAVRIPALLVSLIAICLTFLIGRLVFDQRTGLLAAFLHAINGLVIEVGGGRVSSDVVETFSCVFIEAAMLLALYSIMRNKGPVYALAIGMITGIAVLCKWAPALIVFPLWIFGELLVGNKPVKTIALNFLVAAAGLFVVATPWIYYIFNSFPNETAHILNKFSSAYHETIEKHSGPWYYYFKNTGMVYGELVWIPVLAVAYLFMRRKVKLPVAVILLWWIIPLVVFSFAETKRHTYLLIAAPALFCMTAYGFLFLKHHFTNQKWVAALLIIALIGLPVRYSIERIKPLSSKERHPQWTVDLKKMHGKFKSNTVFVNHPHAVEGMFYTDYIFYEHLPQPNELELIRNKGYEVVQGPDIEF